MPEVKINLPIKNIAQIINSLSKQEIETLFLYLTEEGEELLNRKKDFDLKRVKFISRDEAFDV